MSVDALLSRDGTDEVSIGGESGEMANLTEAGLFVIDFGGECSWKICELANTAITSGASIGTLV